MVETEININPGFKLNGKYYSKDELLNFCMNDSSENIEVYHFIIDWLSKRQTIRIQTSGSTGDPKVYLIKKNKMIASAKKTGEFFKLKQGDKSLLCLPIKFIAGKMMVVRALVLGLDLYVKTPSNNPLKGIKKNFKFVALTPYQLSNSIKNIDKFRYIIIGGSSVNNSLKEKIFRKTKGVFETYGMTETLSHIAVKNLSTGKNEFEALPGVKFKAKNNNLLIIAPHISKRIIKTNDIIKLISEKKFIWIGRKDFIINSGGIKINPEVVENKLNKFYLDRFIICGIPSQKLGEQVVIVFEKRIPENYNLLFNKLDTYERPKGAYFLKSFKNVNGKISRKYIQNEIKKLKNEKSN